MPFRLGPTELIIILAIVLIVFGAGRLSQVGGAMGKGLRQFRKGLAGEEETAQPEQVVASKARKQR